MADLAHDADDLDEVTAHGVKVEHTQGQHQPEQEPAAVGQEPGAEPDEHRGAAHGGVSRQRDHL